MSDKFKEFFSKKIKDAKFKLAGSGRKLNEEPKEGSSSNSQDSQSVPRVEPSREAKMAGLAALQRMQTTDPKKKEFSVKKTARKIIEAEEQALKLENTQVRQLRTNEPGPSSETQTSIEHSSVNDPCFICPLIGPDVLSKQDWMVKIKEYVLEIIETEKDPSYSVLLIKSVNEREKVDFALEKLKACLTNILDNPMEEKFKKIRVNNPLFKDKILPVEGCELFLLSAGFKRRLVEDVEYFVYPYDEPDCDLLTECIKSLSITESIRLTLDRNIKVYQGTNEHSEESDMFFKLSKQELMNEAAKRKVDVEEMQILKTKAMREKEVAAPVYNYTMIKIKFPDGYYIQGTFSVNETVNDVRHFVSENLKSKTENFNLATGLRRCLTDYTKTLLDEQLVPSALLYFEWTGEDEIESGNCLSADTLSLMTQ